MKKTLKSHAKSTSDLISDLIKWTNLITTSLTKKTQNWRFRRKPDCHNDSNTPSQMCLYEHEH